MPSFREVYGQWINAEDLQAGTITGQIVEIGPEIMQGDSRDGGRRKLVCKLDTCEKQIVINRTNAERLAEVWGDDYSQWAGRTISLTLHKVRMGRQLVDGVLITARSEGGV